MALYIVVGGAFNQMVLEGSRSVKISMQLLIDSLFMAGAGMISFGAVIAPFLGIALHSTLSLNQQTAIGYQ